MELVELAGDEMAFFRSEALIDFFYERCFSDSGIPGHHCDLSFPVADPVE